MCRYPPSTIHRYLDLLSTQIIQTHTSHRHNTTPPLPTLIQAPYSLPTYTTHTTATKTQTHVQHSPCPHRIGKAQTQFSHPLTPLSTHTAPSQTHTHVTHSTNTSHKHVTCTRQNTWTTCTTHTHTHRNHTSPEPTPALPSPSHHHTPTTHTHTTQTTVHTSQSPQHRTHNIGCYDNLTNRPRTTTGLLTPRKHTGPAVKVREI